MSNQPVRRHPWRLAIALLVSAVVTLGALIALRGPDWIGPSAVMTVGDWRLAGAGWWQPETPQAALSAAAFGVAGPRGWQNLHVVVPWLALIFWMLSLPARAWRGLAPLAPVLVATVLSSTSAGLSGFGLAVAVLSAWHLLAARRAAPSAWAFPAAAWLALWLSPGAMPLVLAAWIINRRAWTRGQAWGALAAAVFALHLTPRGMLVWSEAWVFARWSPQAAWDLPAWMAIFATLAVLGLAIRASYKDGRWERVAAPGLLMLCGSAGQHAYWWAAALWMIPCWPVAREHIQRFGFRVRWWMQLGIIIAAGLLAAAAAREAWPRWYDLAMTEAAVIPTLTRQALPEGGSVYINPLGRAVARFGGELPPNGGELGAIHLGREPSLWRAFDRRVRHGAVWLLGEKADFAPLARHLGESPDWRLAAVDATGVLFVRAPREEIFPTEPAQELARRMIGGANRSGFLARAALACLTAQARPEADELSAAAVRRSDESSVAATARTLVLIAVGLPQEALAVSGEAVALNPRSSEAWQARAEAFLHAGWSDNAYAAAGRAAELAPGDAGALWLAARTANAARAWQTEAATLERLIALTEGRGGDSGFYRLYLGQSYARQGLTRPAVRALEKAARAPGLTDDQRRQLEEEIEDLRSAPGAY